MSSILNDTPRSLARTILRAILTATPRFAARGLVTALVAACLFQCEGAEPPVSELTFSPDGKSVLAVSQVGVRIFSWPELKLQRTIESSSANLHCLSFSPDGKQFAVGGGDPAEQGSVQLFSWPEGKPLSLFEEHDDSVMSIAWLDDEHILSASRDRQVLLSSVLAKKVVSRFAGHSRSVNSICLLSGRKTLVSSGVDHSVRVWNLETKKLIRSLTQHTKPIHSLAARPDQDGLPMVASAAADRTIRFWQPTIGRMVRYIRLEAEPLAIAWTPDGDKIVAACVDGQVRVVDPIEVTVTRTIEAIEGWAYTVALHPHDGTAVVGGSNGVVKRLGITDVKN